MTESKQFDIFIEDGVIHYQVVADDHTLCSASEPFDSKNPKHQQIQRLVNKMGIIGMPFCDKNGNVL